MLDSARTRRTPRTAQREEGLGHVGKEPVTADGYAIFAHKPDAPTVGLAGARHVGWGIALTVVNSEDTAISLSALSLPH